MEIKTILKCTMALAAVVGFQYADASTPQEALPNNAYRVKYEHTAAMPDHIAYLTLMQDLRETEQQNGHDANIRDIQDHMSLDREHAELFLQFMLSSYNQMISTNRTITNRMLCAGNKPRYNDDQAYQVLDVLDDIKETNLRKYYQRAQVNFGEHIARELGAWLAVIKVESSHHELDHRAAFLHSNESVQQVIGQACNIIASY